MFGVLHRLAIFAPASLAVERANVEFAKTQTCAQVLLIDHLVGNGLQRPFPSGCLRPFQNTLETYLLVSGSKLLATKAEVLYSFAKHESSRVHAQQQS